MVEYTQYRDDGSFMGSFETSGEVPIGDNYISGAQSRFSRLANGEVVAFTESEIDAIESEELTERRRTERADKFSDTLDKMNPIWYSELTSEQQTELATFRNTWLDYPETGVKPDDLDVFNR